MTWAIEKKGVNVHQITFQLGKDESAEDWQQDILLMSDEHYDNPRCDLKLLAKHHKEAVEKDAPIIKVGDVFDAMQGKYDRRADKSDLRPEHQTGDYLDALVRTAGDFYEPYNNQIAIVGHGNHDTSIHSRHETCLVDRLVERLRASGSTRTFKGGYDGWVKFTLTKEGVASNYGASFVLYYHHGWGGGGPVTKGVIDYNRLAEGVIADAYVLGHIHYKDYMLHARKSLSARGIPVDNKVHFIRCGSYMNDYGDGSPSWWIQTGKRARPMGGWWLRLRVKSNGTKRTIRATVHEAD